MNKTGLIVLAIVLFASCSQKQTNNTKDVIVAKGQIPNIAKGKDNKLHLVFGTGDSIMYSYSSDQGHSFSAPELISVLPKVYTFAMRGPQVAVTNNSIVVTAATSKGDIFSFHKEDGHNWVQGGRVNDVDTIAKEGLMSLSADDDNLYAVWLDLRGNKRNKIYGSKSVDGGKTWLTNKMIYTSPDTTVCECCKPSVLIRNNHVYVMFRNWLKGNRDLYVVESQDGGDTFGQAQKLGNGSWKLNGCPMDGGGLAINKNGEIQTVWRREGKIYSDEPGKAEKQVGEGRSCSIETINNKDIYAWTEKENIIVTKPDGQKVNLGKGTLPILRTIDNDKVICIWQTESEIHASVLNL